MTRYRNSRCGILVGISSDDSETSLFAFCQQVLGYDLADFFKRNSGAIKTEITSILEALLSPQ